ncbi:hypothetical protein [Herbaspirillum robiniae]|uniref:Uncharacterized protein n=2 Tax=Herbaspirillum robiniae TaxID=2014887 RepID=A0ABX2LWC6_9BURK|nr:hypothetical protein [Herbaspirillum robiniae]NUU01994.1 hypothetical protein [Herbaspirillum robiniae]
MKFIWPRRREALRAVRLGLVVVAAMALSACVTRQINTESFAEMPVAVGRVLVVYRPAELQRIGQGTQPAFVAEMQRQRQRRIIEMFGDSVEQRLPDGLDTLGIKSRFVRANAFETVLGSQAIRSAFSHVLLIMPQRDQQVCNYISNCSHQLTVRAILFGSSSPSALWRADFEEPFINSVFIYQSRYDELADYVLKGLKAAVKPR